MFFNDRLHTFNERVKCVAGIRFLRPECSFLILVDYTFVLNLDKVDSVKH